MKCWLATIIVFFAACGGCGPTGTLAVSISQPSGVAPDVLVEGPGNYKQTLSKTTTLSGLAPGSYSVLATPVGEVGPITETLFDGLVTGSPATVANKTTASATVTYSQRPGTGVAWFVPNRAGNPLPGFGASLDGGFVTQPELAFAVDAGTPEGVAVDAHGNLWVTFDEGYVGRFTPQQVNADGGFVVPSLTLSGVTVSAAYFLDAGTSRDGGITTLAGPLAVAFDPAGNLYVSDCQYIEAIYRYSAAQLDAGGAVLPELAMVPVAVDAGASTVNSIGCIYGLAFDRNGDLWAANYDRNSVVRFANPSSMTGTVAAMPATVMLSSTSPSLDGGSIRSLQGPNGLAIDTAGALWVANWDGNSVARFAPDSGVFAATPLAQIENVPFHRVDGGVANLFMSAAGVVIDNSGALWVASTSGTLARFANPLSLRGQVLASPERIVESPLLGYLDTGSFTFDPPPANLPIYR